MVQNIASLMAVIGADLTGLNNGLREAETKLGAFSGTMQRVGGQLLGAGMGMTMAATVPIVALGTKMVDAASKFEAATNIMAVAARSSGTSLDELRQAALLVGKDTQLVGIDAMEAADAMTTFYKAGLTTTDMFGDLNTYLEVGTNLTGAMRAAIDLATASDIDLAQASDAVAIAMATFGLGADQATMIADNFVMTADASISEVSDLTAAMSNFGPTAAAYGLSLGGVNTMLALLSERGIIGAEAGTALKSMFTNMMRDTNKTKGAWKALGTSMYDANGNMRSMPTIIADINKGLAGMTEEQRNLTIQNLAGTYGMKALQTLLAEGIGGWEEMSTAIEAAATAEDVGKERTKGFAAAMEQLQGSIQTFMITAGTPLIQNVLTPLIQKITAFVGKLIEADPKVIGFGLAIAVAVAAIGPVMLILGGLATAVGALASPIGLIVLAVGALGAAFVAANGGIGPTIDKLLEIGGAVGTFFHTLQGGAPFMGAFMMAFSRLIPPEIAMRIVTMAQDLIAFGTTALAAADSFIRSTLNISETGNILGTIGDRIMGFLLPALDRLRAFWDWLWPYLNQMFQVVWRDISAFFGPLIEQMVTFFVGTFGRITAWVTENMPLIQATIARVLSAIMALWERVWPFLQDVLSGAWEVMKGLVSSAITIILGVLKSIMQAINGDWQGAWDTLKLTLANAWATMSGTVTRWLEIMKDTFGRLLGSIWDSIVRWCDDIVTTIETKVGEWRDAGAALIEGFIGGIESKAGELIAKVEGAINDAIGKAKALLGIGSPSKLFMDIGQNTMKGMAMGIGQGARVPAAAMQSAMGGVTQSATVNYNSSPIINDRATGLQLLAMTRSRSLTNLAQGAV